MRTSSKSPAPTSADTDLYDLAQIARKAKVSVKTVRRLIASGDLKTHRIGAQIRVSEADWRTFLTRSRQL
jgi:excisionase family DNA binding protein